MAVYHDVHTHTGRYVEPVETETEPVDYGTHLAARVIYLIAGVVLALLAIRFLLVLLGANPANAFASFIYSASYPLAAPFFSLFSYSAHLGRSYFEVGTLVAMIVYGLIAELLVRLVTIGTRRDEL
ncbi:MAG TPA: hypothetical protein VLF69_02240 [Candidatus Saccharimonadales bacterium]|nr:hypothetical protein [Candidatus Saccharimonadales bacterium]